LYGPCHRLLNGSQLSRVCPLGRVNWNTSLLPRLWDGNAHLDALEEAALLREQVF
jgi:hypothetical protein